MTPSEQAAAIAALLLWLEQPGRQAYIAHDAPHDWRVQLQDIRASVESRMSDNAGDAAADALAQWKRGR